MGDTNYSNAYLLSMVKTRYKERGYSHWRRKETRHNWEGVYFYLSWWVFRTHILTYLTVAALAPLGFLFGSYLKGILL